MIFVAISLIVIKNLKQLIYKNYKNNPHLVWIFKCFASTKKWQFDAKFVWLIINKG